jgi:hypothetical protein
VDLTLEIIEFPCRLRILGGQNPVYTWHSMCLLFGPWVLVDNYAAIDARGGRQGWKCYVLVLAGYSALTQNYRALYNYPAISSISLICWILNSLARWYEAHRADCTPFQNMGMCGLARCHPYRRGEVIECDWGCWPDLGLRLPNNYSWRRLVQLIRRTSIKASLTEMSLTYMLCMGWGYIKVRSGRCLFDSILGVFKI